MTPLVGRSLRALHMPPALPTSPLKRRCRLTCRNTRKNSGSPSVETVRVATASNTVAVVPLPTVERVFALEVVPLPSLPLLLLVRHRAVVDPPSRTREGATTSTSTTATPCIRAVEDVVEVAVVVAVPAAVGAEGESRAGSSSHREAAGTATAARSVTSNRKSHTVALLLLII